MAADYAEVERMVRDGLKDPNNTHAIIVCDTYDHEDYPVYVTQRQDVHVVPLGEAPKKPNDQ